MTNEKEAGGPVSGQAGSGEARDARRSAGGAGPTEDGMVAGFVDLLRLEDVGPDVFRGRCHAGTHVRVAFGGQVVAQALAAAGRTVGQGRVVHSLHSSFLRSCDPRLPLEYAVERLRDGHSYTSRTVTVTQRGEALCVLSASFKKPEGGPARQREMPEVPGPDELPDPYADSRGRAADPEDYWSSTVRLTFDGRYVPPGRPGLPQRPAGVEEQFVWMTSATALPGDPLLHAGALAYLSDLTLAKTSAQHLRSSGTARGGQPAVSIASLDHAMWFHRPFRVDEWLLFAQRSPIASDGRGFAQGEFYTRDGHLVASVVQEAVIWERRRSGS